MRVLVRGSARILFAVAFALALPATVNAQQIRGVVVEDSTFLPLSGVKVELIAGNAVVQVTFSSVTGWFAVSPRNAGQYVVRASHPAYLGIGVQEVIVEPLETITLVLRLSGGPIPLDSLLVRGRAVDRLSGYRERSRRGAFGHFITRADIDKRGGYALSHVLRFTPEVRVERVRDGPFTADGVFMRSFGDLCVPAVFLDGVQVPGGTAFDIDALLSVEAVEGIEVYRSALSAPMEFRIPGLGVSDGLCGVIAVWSRPIPGAPFTLKRAFFAGMLVSTSILLRRLFD